jgi:hypothetical protein
VWSGPKSNFKVSNSNFLEYKWGLYYAYSGQQVAYLKIEERHKEGLEILA